ncbi:MAG: hypothetical protein ACXABY_06030, partial [Candidatus Thorarchaeota archaeon]
ELFDQLYALSNALRSTCHRPECNHTYCPELCDCRSRKLGPIRSLNIHTAIAWTLGLLTYQMAGNFEDWRGDDWQTMKGLFREISKAIDALDEVCSFHDRDERIRIIVSLTKSQVDVLRRKLVSGRYNHSDRIVLKDRNENIRRHNLREK